METTEEMKDYALSIITNEIKSLTEEEKSKPRFKERKNGGKTYNILEILSNINEETEFGKSFIEDLWNLKLHDAAKTKLLMSNSEEYTSQEKHLEELGVKINKVQV